MPELREVFEMTTRQVEPDVDAWREQERHQRRSSRNKRVGAFAVAAAIGLAAVVLVFFLNRTEPSANRPAGDPSPTPRTETSGPSFLDLQTGDTTPLPESLLGGSLYFTSPDRTMFVINHCCGSHNPVTVANVDGTGARQVTPEGIDGFGARWSPDGSMLVYQRRDGATSEIGNLFVVDLATGQASRVTDLDPAFYGGWALLPSFSPDGQTIIFHMPRGPNDDVSTRWDLWSVPVAGGEPTLVVRNASHGVYGPDGETLAYIDSPRGDWSSSRLMVAGVDGGDPRLLVQGDEIGFPRWSPDGTRIAYSDTDGTHVVDVSTGEASLVTADAGVLDWFGDDMLLVAP
jgi:dipeptidyl aminopeptidase/acylaminoacyl peptidase